jgi:peptidoglycan/LPS O-acetylase OafA/YrhL
LRAVAVGLVVVYHFWPHRLPGGFIGVDVFFAISGFLIISHVVEEQRRTGRIALARFWARRARRLLPASLLVLAVTAVGTVGLLPRAQWLQAFREIMASTLYVQNWALAADSVDYLAAENLPSPVQHFWSLSTEEQFYLVIPLLMAAAAVVRGRRAMLVALAVVAGASLAWSVHLTATAPGPAYFVTPTRAWEFAAGGLLAFAPPAAGLLRLRAAAAWAGWLAIAAGALLYSSATPFPGYTAALPVLATLAIIWAAGPALPWAPDRLLANPASTFLGDISYSIYLWHWPVLVLAGTALGTRFTWPVKIAAIAGVVLLARWTWRYVENPVRRSRALAIRPARITFAAALTAMAVLVAPLALASSQLRQAAADEVAAAEAAADTATDCFGATYRTGDCTDTTFDHLTPDPAVASLDRPEQYADGCHVGNEDPHLEVCQYGDAAGSFRVALVGDSHSTSWAPTLTRLATENDWSLTTYLKSACPHSAAKRFSPEVSIEQSCFAWNAALGADVRTGPAYDLVFVSHSVTGERYGSTAAAIAGFREAWRMFTDRGAQVLVIRDIPRMTDGTQQCLEENEDDARVCDSPADEAVVGPDLMAEAADGQPGVHVLDLTDRFCWDGTCKAVIGGVVVYRDTDHLTRTFAVTLAPMVNVELRRAGLV